MWELDHKEGWEPKNSYFWIVTLEKTLESPLDFKAIKPVNPKGNQPWIFTGRTDTETEAPILWPPDANYWLIGKDPDAGRNWEQKEKGEIEDEMVVWHHWHNGHEFEQTLENGKGQRSPACCSPRGRKELDMTATEQQQGLRHLLKIKSYEWSSLLCGIVDAVVCLPDPIFRILDTHFFNFLVLADKVSQLSYSLGIASNWMEWHDTQLCLLLFQADCYQKTMWVWIRSSSALPSEDKRQIILDL